MSYEAKCIVELLERGVSPLEAIRAIELGEHLKRAETHRRCRGNRPTLELEPALIEALCRRAA